MLMSKTYQGIPCKQGHDGKRYIQTGRCVRCACEASIRWKIAKPEQARAIRQKYNRTTKLANHRANPIPRMYYAAKVRAKAKGLEFTLKMSDIKIPELCPVFGTPLTEPSLDRTDSKRGYTPDNIVVMSMRANKLKNDGTLEEFEAIVRHLQAAL